MRRAQLQLSRRLQLAISQLRRLLAGFGMSANSSDYGNIPMSQGWGLCSGMSANSSDYGNIPMSQGWGLWIPNQHILLSMLSSGAISRRVRFIGGYCPSLGLRPWYLTTA